MFRVGLPTSIKLIRLVSMVILTPAELVIKINHHTLQDKLVPLTIPKEQEGVLQARTRLVQMMLAEEARDLQSVPSKVTSGSWGWCENTLSSHLFLVFIS